MAPLVDFVVIGGGPAGCAFATLAARFGASVILVERDDYQRPRPGEHIAGRVRPILDALLVPKEQARSIAVLSPGIMTAWQGDQVLDKAYGLVGQAPGLCVVRHRFDELLSSTARAAGAAVVVRGRPIRIERRRTRDWSVTITTSEGNRDEVIAASIADASGRSARVVRAQGGRRLDYGDLVAIVRWLRIESPPSRAGAHLMIQASSHGWWSLSVVQDGTLVVTFYTSLSVMRASGATPGAWWAQALEESRRIGSIVRECGAVSGPTRVYRVCPSRSSQLVGEGWIAIGDAAISLDPLGGQGVALALESACRAAEAAQTDPSFALLGKDYRDALLSRFDAHLDARFGVYRDAAATMSPAFMHAAVTAGTANVH